VSGLVARGLLGDLLCCLLCTHTCCSCVGTRQHPCCNGAHDAAGIRMARTCDTFRCACCNLLTVLRACVHACVRACVRALCSRWRRRLGQPVRRIWRLSALRRLRCVPRCAVVMMAGCSAAHNAAGARRHTSLQRVHAARPAAAAAPASCARSRSLGVTPTLSSLLWVLLVACRRVGSPRLGSQADGRPGSAGHQPVGVQPLR
jgi:hypothetical protein